MKDKVQTYIEKASLNDENLLSNNDLAVVNAAGPMDNPGLPDLPGAVVIVRDYNDGSVIRCPEALKCK